MTERIQNNSCTRVSYNLLKVRVCYVKPFRMNTEVQKSAEKRAAVLKASNSSAEQMMQWTCEHADEVLTKPTHH